MPEGPLILRPRLPTMGEKSGISQRTAGLGYSLSGEEEIDLVIHERLVQPARGQDNKSAEGAEEQEQPQTMAVLRPICRAGRPEGAHGDQSA
ncbi:MAG: hypothetical protein C4289_06065 [Chloroflexota bacterium]